MKDPEYHQNPSPEEIALWKKLSLGYDRATEIEAIRMAQRRGETQVLVFDPDGNLRDVLDPDDHPCNPGYYGDPPCGGCDDCLVRQAYYYKALVLDCRPSRRVGGPFSEG